MEGWVRGQWVKVFCPKVIPSHSQCSISAAQKIKKLSETPVTVHNIAKLCVIDGKNRKITKKLVQRPRWTNGNFNLKMTKKIKWPKITFPGSKMVPKVSKWGF